MTQRFLYFDLYKLINTNNQSTQEKTNLLIHQISVPKGAIKKSIFHNIKDEIFKKLLFSFIQTISHQIETIIEYPIRVYGVLASHHIKNGFT